MIIRFIQTAHREGDDRVTYHQIPTLQAAGHDVSWAVEVCDVAICDTPKAVLRAKRAGARTIIYDVTEWYPSPARLNQYSWWKRPLLAIGMTILNLTAGLIADRFIFGERDKARPFRLLFPWKRHIDLPYYPSTDYIHPRQTADIQSVCRLLYAGPETTQKGYNRVLEVVRRCQEARPEMKFELRAITPRTGYLKLEDFCREIAKADIALDLRDKTKETNRCLPIKWFYYAASGVPSIYVNLRAIREQVPEFAQASTLVDTTDEAVAAILHYIDHPEVYKKASEAGIRLHQRQYNWEAIRSRLLEIVQ